MAKNNINTVINSASTTSSAQSTNNYMQYPRYRNKQGHGWTAEDANAMADRLSGKRVDQVGRDNSLNGADRISNGIEIQTKYCASPSKTIGAAFSDGSYRYGKMKLEVPKEQYDECVRLMADKIRSGEVPGVSDPAMAKDIVVRGNCTYDQAVNIAKAGTLDSVKFDLKTQSVSCSITFGFSFAIGYANALRNGKMSAGEFVENTTSNAAGIGGGYAGGTFGAAVGTALFPGVGTVVGGMVDGIVGGIAGSSVVRGIFSIFD